MADDFDSPKRKTLGSIPVSKLASTKQFKEAWKIYDECSERFAKAKSESSEAKSRLKSLMQKYIPSLKSAENLDFIVVGDTVSVFEIQKSPRRKTRTSELEIEV
jgi:hypothetical protein